MQCRRDDIISTCVMFVKRYSSRANFTIPLVLLNDAGFLRENLLRARISYTRHGRISTFRAISGSRGRKINILKHSEVHRNYAVFFSNKTNKSSNHISDRILTFTVHKCTETEAAVVVDHFSVWVDRKNNFRYFRKYTATSRHST